MQTAVCLAFSLSLLAYQLTVTQGIRAEIPGRCTGTCTTNFERVFFECVEQIDRGCALQQCDSPAGGATCDLRSGFPNLLFTGEDVTLFDVPVGSPLTTQIGISGVRSTTDVYFLVDGTGSMGSGIGALQDMFSRITEALGATGDFAYGVGLYRDERQLEMGFRNLQSITTDTDAVERGINRLGAQNGGDTEEANLVALYKVATEDFVNWREGATRIILLFGDAVGHEPTCFDDVELTRQVVTDALNEAKITVQAVESQFGDLNSRTSQFGCGRGRGRAPAGQTTFIAEGTGGTFSRLRRDNAANVLSTFTDVLSTAATTVDVAESTCDRGLQFSFDPPLPASIGPDLLLNTVITVRRRVCTLEFFECSISFGAGDSVSEPIRLQINPTGCRS